MKAVGGTVFKRHISALDPPRWYIISPLFTLDGRLCINTDDNVSVVPGRMSLLPVVVSKGTPEQLRFKWSVAFLQREWYSGPETIEVMGNTEESLNLYPRGPCVRGIQFYLGNPGLVESRPEVTVTMEETQGRELVEVQPPELPAGASWQPVVGEEALALFESQTTLSLHERDRLRDESVSILAQCVAPTAPDAHHSGLVVGSIQSGKTLSFTTVAALARDNRYRVVIVLTGTVKILNSQSVKRLVNLLRIGSRSDFAWRLLRNPRATQAQAQELDGIIQDWNSPVAVGLQPQTLLITVLKNATHLRNLARLLGRLDLSGVPTLVIDDEADQAGLNTAVNQGSESTTHRELRNLRAALPHHTYLGYTATPQAPLLINIMDILSARFVQVLTTGADYTGGTQFFEHDPSLIRTIPSDQIPSRDNPMREPPESLLDAIRVFFVGVAAGIVHGPSSQGSAQNRSMLVHPSMLTAQHAAFSQWVQTLKSSWSRLLDSSDGTEQQDRDALISEFRRAHDDLAQTEPHIPAFSQILPVLTQAVRRTVIYEINRRPANQFQGIDDIDEFWRSNYSFILVGGQSLERGFTVEGLTTTYMPRGIGVAQADTVQQRARFYGYNRGHLGYCRVYLETAARDAYQVYIDHEDRLRRSLAEHSESGRPLNEWRRTFFLDASLKPTRDAVLVNDYTRGPSPNVPHEAMPPLYSPEDLEENRRLIRNFVTGLPFVPDDGDPRRTVAQHHEVVRDIPARSVFEHLIVPLRIEDPADSWIYLQIRLQIQRYLESHPNALCTVYRMRPRATEFERMLTKSGNIEPYQGDNPGTGYRGDRTIFARGQLTIQIYEFARIYSRAGEQRGNVLATNVPQIAIVLPPEIAVGMVAQSQGTV